MGSVQLDHVRGRSGAHCAEGSCRGHVAGPCPSCGRFANLNVDLCRGDKRDQRLWPDHLDACSSVAESTAVGHVSAPAELHSDGYSSSGEPTRFRQKIVESMFVWGDPGIQQALTISQPSIAC